MTALDTWRACLLKRWRGFESCRGHPVMSQDIGDRPNLRVRSVACLGSVLPLVVPGGDCPEGVELGLQLP